MCHEHRKICPDGSTRYRSPSVRQTDRRCQQTHRENNRCPLWETAELFSCNQSHKSICHTCFIFPRLPRLSLSLCLFLAFIHSHPHTCAHGSTSCWWPHLSALQTHVCVWMTFGGLKTTGGVAGKRHCSFYIQQI